MNCSCFLIKNNLRLKICIRTSVRFLTSNNARKKLNETSNTGWNLNSLPISYKNLFPWKTQSEFSQFIVSSVIYNKDGLIAINKPYGIKVKNLNTSAVQGSYKDASSDFSLHEEHFGPKMVVNPFLPDCNYTLEDAMPSLREHLNVSELIISKSCERYASGLVLLSSSKKVHDAVRKSFKFARHQHKNYLTFWIITLGYPVINLKKEDVGLSFMESEGNKMKQAVIVDGPSKRSRKRRLVLFFRVEYRTLCINPDLETSLVEISSSSDSKRFIRVYASNSIATVLGDPLYSCRMQKLLGIPVKTHLQNFESFNMQPIPDQMAAKLHLPKGVMGHMRIPTMVHLRSVLLPSFNGEDLILSAELPPHFKWMTETLNLL